MPPPQCSHCGSKEIQVDHIRGDSFCTDCHTVHEVSTIVSEVQFENNVAKGQFVGIDSTGSSFNRPEPREVTLHRARSSFNSLGQSLRLSRNYIDMAFRYYKLLLGKMKTRGRRHEVTIGACMYIVCRMESTGHLLIDISHTLQVSVYEVYATYTFFLEVLNFKNIPWLDPTMYVLRFSSCLGFGDQTYKVSETASRIVKRMMKDSIDIGRRPSGLCGAALLIAARLHNFNRTVSDIIKIVRVHESTLKKRMMEFGETPSSSLTLDEFMAVDLEEEQDPPSFLMAQNQDKEKLQKMMDSELLDENFTEIQQQIDMELEDRILRSSTKRKRGMATATTAAAVSSNEEVDTENFIRESTMNVINECVPDNTEEQASTCQSGLGPNIESFGLAKTINECMEIREGTRKKEQEDPPEQESESADFDDIDDDEINSYIMSESESSYKANLWNHVNAEYLKQQEEKAERLAKDKEEGKPEKKKRKTTRKKRFGEENVASTAGEAIVKMLKEKKLSSKINYDVLKNLNFKTEKSQVKFETPPTVAKIENIVPIEKVEKTEKESTEMSLMDHESDFEDDYMEDEPPSEEDFSVMRQIRHMTGVTYSDCEEDY